MDIGQINIRPASQPDDTFLYDLRNHEGTRRFMFDPSPVSREVHKKWFQDSLVMPTREMSIICDNRTPLGQIRFDNTADCAEVDISLKNSIKCKGYGTLLLILTCYDYLAKYQDIKLLQAKIKNENIKSIRAFLKSGFQMHQKYQDYTEFRLYPNNPNMVVATTKSWNIDNFFDLKKKFKNINWVLLKDISLLQSSILDKIKPGFVFFPHWSWMIPENVFKIFKCVVFHMTDLPFGRGGSPLQNLIARGIYETKISAIQVVEDLDAGDIYCKEDLNLEHGNADTILKKASSIIFKRMIPLIITQTPIPEKQKGEVVCFDRRKPEDGDLSTIENIHQAYDTIRMLDGEGYPPAFINIPGHKLQFKDAKKDGDSVVATCIIRKQSN